MVLSFRELFEDRGVSCIDWVQVFAFLKSLSVIVAAGVAIYGLSTWKRQDKWKRKVEEMISLAKSFDDAKSTLIGIRRAGFNQSEMDLFGSPESLGSKKGELKSWLVFRDRYNKESSVFSDFMSKKIVFQLLYPKVEDDFFNEMSEILSDVYVSGYRLNQLFQRKSLSKEENEELTKARPIFFADYKNDSNDVIEQKLSDLEKRIYKFAKDHI